MDKTSRSFPGMYRPGEVPRRCKACGSDHSRVVKTQPYTELECTWRTRLCECGERYQTKEKWNA